MCMLTQLSSMALAANWALRASNPLSCGKGSAQAGTETCSNPQRHTVKNDAKRLLDTHLRYQSMSPALGPASASLRLPLSMSGAAMKWPPPGPGMRALPSSLMTCGSGAARQLGDQRCKALLFLGRQVVSKLAHGNWCTPPGSALNTCTMCTWSFGKRCRLI